MCQILSKLVLLGLVFLEPCQEIGWEERLQNDLFCVEWDVKPYLILLTGGGYFCVAGDDMRTVTFITATCLCLLFCYVCQCCEGDDTLSFSSRICRCIMQWILVLHIVH